MTQEHTSTHTALKSPTSTLQAVKLNEPIIKQQIATYKVSKSENQKSEKTMADILPQERVCKSKKVEYVMLYK